MNDSKIFGLNKHRGKTDINLDGRVEYIGVRKDKFSFGKGN